MLKLPKGLKKKKKDKKSKKNQELFTEEELAAYKLREQREKQGASEAAEQFTASQPSESCSTSNAQTKATSVASQPGDEDEWSKFNALTTGVDSILKKTQGNLDRIKESSFYQRVAPKSEQPEKRRDDRTQVAKEEKPLEESTQQAVEVPPTDEEAFLARSVVELSESEEESDDGDDIFDTAYIDTLASANVELYVPESPEEEFDVGPDPFDTAYAEKIINGPEVSKRGKKLVNIGAAVEVLTGRVEKVAQNTAVRRPRRGLQNLLLESFDEGSGCAPAGEATVVAEAPVHNLLDDIPDDIVAAPIDLTGSLHIQFLKEQQEKAAAEEENRKKLIAEFETEDDDAFNELAAESLSKQKEVHVLNDIVSVPDCTSDSAADWGAFADSANAKGKPPVRPPPPRIVQEVDILEDFPVIDGTDPFDTTFAERVLPLEDDDDFDPRKEDDLPVAPEPAPVDLLNETNEELDSLAHHNIVLPNTGPIATEIDPFDTSDVALIVQPKSLELSILEKELLSDSDFDPRADEPLDEIPKIDLNRRKSSLSLNITSANFSLKTVGFSNDLLGANISGGSKIQKPLTPYYSQKLIEEADKECEDPFDTSYVPAGNPSQVELNILEKDLLEGSLQRTLSDPDFDPRAVTPVPSVSHTGLLDVEESHDIKVLTPAFNRSLDFGEDSLDTYVDPFDTSAIEKTILPGRAELKIIENELLPNVITEFSSRVTVLDSCSDSQELGLGDKVLTPQIPITTEESLELSDPFDTSIANNLAPGQAEIKQIESELIHQ